MNTVEQHVETKLDRLNHLLKGKDVQVPDFRRHISPSFSNLPWLKKALQNSTNQELTSLLNLPQHKLLEPV